MHNKQGFAKVIKDTICMHIVLTIVLFITIIAAVVAALLPPLVLEDIINRITGGTDIYVGTAVAYFMILAISGILDGLKEVLITIYGQKVTRQVREEMCLKLQRLPAHYYIENEPGVVTSRFTSDTNTVQALFDNGVISMMVDGCKVISIIIVIFAKSKGLGIIMLFVTPLLFVLTRVFQKKMLKAQTKNRIAIGKVNNHIPETISNIRTIHAMYKEDYMEQKYDRYIDESYKAIDRSNVYDSIYSPIIIWTSCIIVAAIMVASSLGGTMQQFFGMSVGTAVAVIAYVGKVFDPLESIGMEIQNIQTAAAGIKRIDEFLKEKERVMPNGDVLVNLDNNGIIFDNVTFGYDDIKILKNYSCNINSGENVTFTGRTGSGKSTVFKLILGLYNPNTGSVQVCGVDAGNIPDEYKRKIFGYVEQNFHMVRGSIADQISLFDENISREQIIEAATISGIHNVIINLEDGYDTVMSEGLFSKGQIQLLAIARAVVGNPVIMLMDEITANLDSNTEKQVIDAIGMVSKKRTMLSISHRVYGGFESREEKVL